MEKPKYEQLRGLSPTIAIEQKTASSNPRSTVGTITEIYDYLRVLYARAGEQRCHLCGGAVAARTAAEIVDELLTLPAKTKAALLARKAENRKGEFRELFEEARKAGFVRVRIDGLIERLEDVAALDKKKKHTIELVIDRVTIDAADRARADRLGRGGGEGGRRLACWSPSTARRASARTARRAPARTAASAFPSCRRRPSRSTPRSACASSATASARASRSIPDLVVPDPNLSIRDGAIAPWGDRTGRDEGWTANVAAAVSREFGIQLDKPWKKLTPRQREVLLYGTGDERVEVTWAGKHGSGSWAMSSRASSPPRAAHAGDRAPR